MTTSQARILVVEDEPDLLTLYELTLVREGYQVTCATDVAQALSALAAQPHDLIVTDMRLPDGTGMDILQHIQSHKRSEPCMVITAFGSAENAVEALKAGAFDYLTKPVDLKRLRQSVRTCLNGKLAEQPTTTSHQSVGHMGGELAQRIVGDHPSMHSLRQRIAKVAPSMAPVLIHGESGTGKELVARAIHACSHRAAGSFVAVNCGAIPESLLEAEFFGVKKGAYTGAHADRVGYFQAAQGGTLFLDEIGDLPLVMQPKLLRAIQERMVRAIGGAQEEGVDVRIVSASHKNLNAEVAAGRFRQDLFYRLHVIGVEVPALRDRKSDLPNLCAHLLSRLCAEARKAPPLISSASLAWLSGQPLQGNVRELENVLHRALALHETGPLELEQHDFYDALPMFEESVLPEFVASKMPLDSSLAQLERQQLQTALQKNNNNQTKAAAQLGLTLRQIRYRLAKLGIKP